MDRYLMRKTAGRDTDVLEWWKLNSDEYPTLARIARDYLAIPATSASVERVFSGGTHLVTDRRGSLGEETIEALVCLGEDM